MSIYHYLDFVQLLSAKTLRPKVSLQNELLYQDLKERNTLLNPKRILNNLSCIMNSSGYQNAKVLDTDR